MVSEQNTGGGESFRPRFQFLSRWPSSSGGGLQSRRQWCEPSTGFHFVFIVLPWALMQQTLLQFYLLGRLLALLPKQYLFAPIIITGSCFGLVHLPDVWTASVTVASGMAWSFIYYRYRLLLPLAFSHAALGSAFYYGIFGHDLAVEWRALWP